MIIDYFLFTIVFDINHSLILFDIHHILGCIFCQGKFSGKIKILPQIEMNYR